VPVTGGGEKRKFFFVGGGKGVISCAEFPANAGVVKKRIVFRGEGSERGGEKKMTSSQKGSGRALDFGEEGGVKTGREKSTVVRGGAAGTEETTLSGGGGEFPLTIKERKGCKQR